MPKIGNSWTVQQFRHNFDTVFWAATKAPQMVTVRGRPTYVLIPGSKTEAKSLKADVTVTLHKLQNVKHKTDGSSKSK